MSVESGGLVGSLKLSQKMAHRPVACTLRAVLSRRLRGGEPAEPLSHCCVVGAVAAPGIVKRRAQETLRARGVEATIRDVRLRWDHAELVDVHAILEGVAGVSADLGVVSVGYGGAHSVDARVCGRCGVGRGRPEGAIGGWRSRHPSSSSGEASAGGGRLLALHEVTGFWHVGATELASGRDGGLGLGSAGHHRGRVGNCRGPEATP